MKDLGKFDLVKQALSQITAQSDVSNGTQGIELLAHFWGSELVYDKAKAELQTQIAGKILGRDLDSVKKLQEQLEKLPKTPVVTIWKLVEPIKRIQGTKIVHDGEKSLKISMENVTTLYIPEDAIKLELLEYEETKDIMSDSQGREAKVLRIKLKKGLIDVAAPIHDGRDRLVREKRAYVTAISYRSMQTVGELMSKERMNKRRRYGFEEMA